MPVMRFNFFIFLVTSIVIKPNLCLIGGSTASKGEWPWHGGVVQWFLNDLTFECGCVLVHSRWALTSAFCVNHGPVTELRFGSIDLTLGIIAPILSIAVHPDYSGTDDTNYINDLAIIETNVPIGDEVQVIPGGIDTGIDRQSHTCWLTGWGNYCHECGYSLTLRKLETSVIDDSVCRSRWDPNFDPSVHVCTWKLGTTACNFDEGGPLICRANNAEPWQLVGIISSIEYYCDTSFPTISTRLSNFRSFICSVTGGDVAC